MEHRQMERFRFDGTSIEEIHTWMHGGAGVKGIAHAVENLEGLAQDLQHSRESLRKALEEIGVGWEGTAGEGAGSSIDETATWTVAATPVVESSTDSTQSIGDDFAQTRTRMPTPQEAELTTVEHVVAQSVPLVGPLVDRALADAKRDQVTNEARQRMNEWQAIANDSVEGVAPLPPVPQPVVDVAPTQAAAAGAVSGTGSAGPAGSLPSTQVPVPPGGQPPAIGGSPVVPGPGGPVSPGVPPVSPGSPPVSPGVSPPGGSPGPVGQPPVGQPARPPSGPGFMPVPIGGIGPAGAAPGRRQAFGPGMYSAEEIARARGGAGLKGVAGAAADPGGAAGLKGAASGGQEAAGRAAAKGTAGAVAEGGPAGARGSAAGATGPGASRGGAGLLQPAIGAGGRGEDDGEHSDKYADKTDEHFTEGIQRVAPPVIGG
jgi:PPE family